MSFEPGPSRLCIFESFLKRDEAPRAQSSRWVELRVIRLNHVLFAITCVASAHNGKGSLEAYQLPIFYEYEVLVTQLNPALAASSVLVCIHVDTATRAFLGGLAFGKRSLFY